MKFKLILFFAFIVMSVIFIYIGTNWVEVTRKEIVSNELRNNEKIKIIHISDLHGKDFGNNNKEIIDIIKEENPDIILLTGDMINSRNDDGSAAVSLLQNLQGKYPVYYSYGNHEQYCRLNTPEIFLDYEEKVKKSGCIILDNEIKNVEINSLNLTLYGLTSIPYHKKVSETYLSSSSFNVEFINEIIGRPSNESVNILLAHDPTWFDLYTEWGANIVFSGHMHGGAIRLPFLGGVVSPNRELFPKYDAGLFKKDQTVLHISRGLGTSVERIRIFNRPEITVLNIISSPHL